ncbi:MAG: glycosyltransferase family 9 protein [Acidobacteria bacterium]|nr:glycosyltransferase family 9 protein [Acidobacteriota bacterium]MYJ05997.1 glycosyltransferase family 9 protein [Acidobacteriota bacterium]
MDVFEHLQIDKRYERWLAGTADLALAPLAAINAWRQPAANHEAPPRRVLLFRLERIGDLLMTLGAISAVRARLPKAELRLVVGSWNAPLARCIPAVDAVETFDVPWLSRERPGSTLRAATAQSTAWRQHDYELAINFEPDIRSNALVAASGARHRVGYASGGGGGFLTVALDYDRSIHSAANAQRLVDEALPAERYSPVVDASNAVPFVVPQSARETADHLLAAYRGNGPLVGINPGAGRLVKEWPPERFAAVAAALAADAAATIVLLGGEGDRQQAEGVRQALPLDTALVDLVGQAPLVDLAAVLSRLSVLITGDTGPAHLAAAVDTPVVTIFGPTDPNRYRPLTPRAEAVHADLWCRPCGRLRRPPARCAHGAPDCLTGVETGAVLAAARRYLA